MKGFLFPLHCSMNSSPDRQQPFLFFVLAQFWRCDTRMILQKSTEQKKSHNLANIEHKHIVKTWVHGIECLCHVSVIQLHDTRVKRSEIRCKPACRRIFEEHRTIRYHSIITEDILWTIIITVIRTSPNPGLWPYAWTPADRKTK